jgi:tape measure domain-containing protein
MTRSLGRVAKIGGVAGAFALGKFVKDGIAFNATMEQNRIAFTQFLGSAKAARKELAVLYQIAKTTPFEFKDVTLAARKFSAFGFSVKDTNKLLRTLADTASGLALDPEGIDRMVLAIGQIKSKGVLMSQDLRQLQELGAIDMSQLAKDLGLTAQEVGDIGKQHVPAVAALQAIQMQWNRTFGGQSQKQAMTLNGQLSTLKDNYRQFAGSLTSGTFDFSKTILGKLNTALTQINEEYRKHPKLSLDAKIEIAKDKLAPVAKEIANTIGTQLQRAHLGDKIVAALNAAIPVIAKSAGKLGVATAKAFAKAFVGGDDMTRLALGAFFISKFIGWGNIFRKVGKAAGARFAEQFALTSSAGIAAEVATEGAIGGAVAGRGALGKWGRFGRLAGRSFGVAAAVAIGIEIVKNGGNIGDLLMPFRPQAGSGPKGAKVPPGWHIDFGKGGVGVLVPNGAPKGFNNPAVVPGGAFSDRRSVNAAAARYGIPSDLLWGVYGVETGHGSNVKTSSAGAKGAFQFMPGTAPGYNYPYTNKQTPKIFTQQALGAAHYLSDLLKRFHGDVGAALKAYSGGGYSSVPGFGGRSVSVGKGGQGPIKWKGVGAKGKDNTMVERASLQNAIDWLKKNYPNVFPGTFIESPGTKNQHLHISDVNHKQLRSILRALNDAGFNVGEYGGRPIPGVGGITTTKHKHYGPGDHYSGGAADINADQLLRFFGPRRTKPQNIFHSPVLTNKDFLAFVQSRIDHFDLMVRAGLMSATKATLKKAEAIKSRLPYVTGDTKLELLAMLRDLGGGKTPAEKTWTPQAKQRLAMAIIQANPGNVASLPAAVFKAAGASATMQNPWMQAFQQNLTNQVGAGVLTQAQADDALRPVLERTLPFLTGQDAADVRTKLFEIATNTKDTARAALDTANSVRASGISDAQFLGGLTGPAADAVRGILAQYGIVDLPGGGSIAEIGSSPAAVALAKSDIGTLMEEVHAGQVSFADVWPQILSDLGVIASGAEASAEASNAATDAVKELTDQVKRQTDFATSVANTESAAMARWVTEVISKQMGFGISGRGQTPGYGVARRS